MRRSRAASVAAAPIADSPAEREAFRRELGSGVLFAGILAVLELGPSLAKKAFAASDLEVALLASGQAGLLLNLVSSHYAERHGRVAIVTWLQAAASLAVLAVAVVRPEAALAFVAFHVIARLAYSMTLSTRVVVWGANFSTASRGRRVGRIRQAQILLTTVIALGVAVCLDWSSEAEWIVSWLGDCPLSLESMLPLTLAAIGTLGLLGTLVYRSVREPPRPRREREPFRRTWQRFREVWRRDPHFRRYQILFFILGSSNIMVDPLVPIYAVDRFGASYAQLALSSVAIVQGTMAISMVWWGRHLDRSTPSRLRGVLNWVLAVEAICLLVAPSIEFVYLGAFFRGLALGGGTLLWLLGPLWFATKDDAEIYTGIHACLTGARWLLAPFLGVAIKWLAGGDVRIVFAIAALVLIVVGALLWRDGASEPARAPDRRAS